jgi:hypothetical protein
MGHEVTVASGTWIAKGKLRQRVTFLHVDIIAENTRKRNREILMNPRLLNYSSGDRMTDGIDTMYIDILS